MSKGPSLFSKALKGATDFAAGMAVIGVLLVVSASGFQPPAWSAGLVDRRSNPLSFRLDDLPWSCSRLQNGRDRARHRSDRHDARFHPSTVRADLCGQFGGLFRPDGMDRLSPRPAAMDDERDRCDPCHPMWLIGTIMPLSSILAVLAIVESLRTRRDLIELPDPLQGMPRTPSR